MEPGSSHARYRFGPFEFDAATLELRKKDRLVRVRPQPLKLLALILARPGELVTRDEIRQALWGADTFVDVDQGVNHCVKQLRFALGDDAESPRYLETLPRRGYRFVAPVGRSEAQAAPGSAPRAPAPHDGEQASFGDARAPLAVPRLTARFGGWRAWFAPAILAVGLGILLVMGLAGSPLRRTSAPPGNDTTEITIAPFSSSPDPALGLGLAHEITRRLAAQPSLSLRAVPSASDSGHEGARRPAGLVLEGEIDQSGGVVTVSTRLRHTERDQLVWSHRFTVGADDLFSVEDVIAERVVEALRLRVAAAEQARLRRRYTSKAAAYQDYLRGRAAMVEYTADGTRRAIEAFERALASDSGFTLARAGLAAACADMYLRFAPAGDPDGWAARAEQEARAALDLDGDLAEAHLARAAVARKREFDWETAIAASRRALVLNPSLDQAHFFIAAAYYHLGFMAEALIEMERGRRLEGADAVEPLRIEALVALFSGRFAPALAQLEEVSRRTSQPIGDTYLGLAQYYTGHAEQAERTLRSLTSHPSASTAARSGAALAGVLAARGEAGAARELVQQVLAREYRDHHVAYGLGAAYAQLGDTANAILWLRTAADTGFPCVIWFEHDPLLAPLKGQPSFADLLAHARTLRDSVRDR